jgi:hypothetical protein
MMAILRMRDLDLAGKRVLVREDLNVPVKDGKVTSEQRILAALPTLRLALEKGAAVMVTSHLGRPNEGSWSATDSLAPVAARLSELLGREVPLLRDWVDGVAVAPGELVLLENCRMNVGEGKDDEALARKYAALCDVFVMDAFGTAHRAQASTHGVIRFAPVACGGPLLMAELDALAKRARGAQAPAAGDRRRLQGVHQARTARQPGRQGGPADRRWRHRQHLPRRARPADRQVAERARPARHRARDHGRRRRARRAHPAAGGRGGRRPLSPPTPRRW